MNLEHEAVVAGAPAAVRGALTSEAFLRDYAEVLGATVAVAEASGETTRLVAAVPTTGVPPVFSKLVGSTLTIEDLRTYGADSAQVRVTAAPFVIVDGSVSWEGRADGTCLRTVVEIRARVPLVGGRLEAAVRDLLRERVLEAQASALRKYL